MIGSLEYFLPSSPAATPCPAVWSILTSRITERWTLIDIIIFGFSTNQMSLILLNFKQICIFGSAHFLEIFDSPDLTPLSLILRFETDWSVSSTKYDLIVHHNDFCHAYKDHHYYSELRSTYLVSWLKMMTFSFLWGVGRLEKRNKGTKVAICSGNHRSILHVFFLRPIRSVISQ